MCYVYTKFPCPTTPVSCFKVYDFTDETSHRDLGNFEENGLALRYVYQSGSLIVKKGELIVSNRESRELTNIERSYGALDKGIHVWLSRSGAIYDLKTNRTPGLIIEVEVLPEDILGKGTFLDHNTYACHQIKPLKIIAYTKAAGIYSDFHFVEK